MSRISPEQKMLKYFTIYEHIYEDPSISVYALSEKTDISRNTVSAYLREMYAKKIISGPFLSMKKAQNYTEYLYLMNFSHPLTIFEGLQEFPHVVYHAVTFGDWNTCIISDTPLDFSQLIGCESLVYTDEKIESQLLKARSISWDGAFRDIQERIQAFSPAVYDDEQKVLPVLSWESDQWALYHAFKEDIRQPATPQLKKIGVRFELYKKWKKIIADFCTIPVGFYPEYRDRYGICMLLLSTKYEKEVKSLFSQFPTSSLYMGMENGIMIGVYVKDPDCMRTLCCMIFDMMTKGIIEGYKYAQLIDEWHHCE
jgi:hypothetical protein